MKHEWREVEYVPVWVLDSEYGQAIVRWKEGVWDAILRIPGKYEHETYGMKIDLPLEEPTKTFYTTMGQAKEQAEKGLADYDEARKIMTEQYVYPPPNDPDEYDTEWSEKHTKTSLGLWR